MTNAPLSQGTKLERVLRVIIGARRLLQFLVGCALVVLVLGAHSTRGETYLEILIWLFVCTLAAAVAEFILFIVAAFARRKADQVRQGTYAPASQGARGWRRLLLLTSFSVLLAVIAAILTLMSFAEFKVEILLCAGVSGVLILIVRRASREA